jgi:hypothetical protein
MMAENFDIERFLKRVVSAKARAKSARDDRDWQRAVEILDEWIDRVQEAKERIAPRATEGMDAELADLYGLVGGTQLRWGLQSQGLDRESHLAASVTAYDAGFRYEQTLKAKHATTYNRINRLTGRILLEPTLLQTAQIRPVQVDMAHELIEAEEILTRQIESGGRQRDPWAYCDLATVRLLRGTPEALATLGKLIDLRPLKFVYESTLDRLEPLAQAAADIRPDLEAAVTQLRRVAEYAT